VRSAGRLNSGGRADAGEFPLSFALLRAWVHGRTLGVPLGRWSRSVQMARGAEHAAAREGSARLVPQREEHWVSQAFRAWCVERRPYEETADAGRKESDRAWEPVVRAGRESEFPAARPEGPAAIRSLKAAAAAVLAEEPQEELHWLPPRAQAEPHRRSAQIRFSPPASERLRRPRECALRARVQAHEL